MTEIDVPDWVVKAAEDARVRCLNAVTAYGSAGVDERYHMAMKAAITAALGAWVVPTACTEQWRIDYLSSYPRNTVEVSSMDTLSAGDMTLYTLRQEKPDVLP